MDSLKTWTSWPIGNFGFSWSQLQRGRCFGWLETFSKTQSVWNSWVLTTDISYIPVIQLPLITVHFMYHKAQSNDIIIVMYIKTKKWNVLSRILGDDIKSYGRQRVWGAVGWGMSTLLVGACVDWYSEDPVHKNYLPVYVISMIFLICHFIVASQLEVSPNNTYVAHESV